MIRHSLSLLLIGLSLVATRLYGDELTTAELAQFTPISTAIEGDATLTLYEGLPHQNAERKLLEQELKTKKTIKIADYPFYQRPLQIDKKEIETLRKLSAARDTYKSFAGEKFCGGFHPDYALAWSNGDDTYYLLICLGCQEMKLSGPKQMLRVDLRRDGYEAFRKILTKYRDQRPKSR